MVFLMSATVHRRHLKTELYNNASSIVLEKGPQYQSYNYDASLNSRN